MPRLSLLQVLTALLLAVDASRRDSVGFEVIAALLLSSLYLTLSTYIASLAFQSSREFINNTSFPSPLVFPLASRRVLPSTQRAG